jgi:hypothetical protein
MGNHDSYSDPACGEITEEEQAAEDFFSSLLVRNAGNFR